MTRKTVVGFALCITLFVINSIDERLKPLWETWNEHRTDRLYSYKDDPDRRARMITTFFRCLLKEHERWLNLWTIEAAKALVHAASRDTARPQGWISACEGLIQYLTDTHKLHQRGLRVLDAELEELEHAISDYERSDRCDRCPAATRRAAHADSDARDGLLPAAIRDRSGT